MRNFTENLSPEDRRVYRRWLGGLVGFYAALMTVTIGAIAGDQWSKNWRAPRWQRRSVMGRREPSANRRS